MEQAVRRLKGSNKLKSNDAFVVNQINFVGTLGENVGKNPTARIYRNDPSIQFHRKIHEQLYKKSGRLMIGYCFLSSKKGESEGTPTVKQRYPDKRGFFRVFQKR